MTAPSNAELREAIEEILRPDRTDYFVKKTTDQILTLFQAREQQMISELKKEAVKYRLADGSPELAVPVSVIERYREGL